MKLIKFIGLPTPKDLGWAKDDYNALEVRSFSPNSTTTWEDYYELLHRRYPVRYFLFIAIPDFIDKYWYPIKLKFKDFTYYLRSHYHKYHLLDLRQKSGTPLS